MKTLQRQTALIICDDKGSGPAIAERYAALGADIVIHHLSNEQGIQQLISNIKAMGAKIVAVNAGINNETELGQLFRDAKAKFKKISIIVIDQIRLLQYVAQQVADHGRVILIGSLDPSQTSARLMEPIVAQSLQHAKTNVTINAILLPALDRQVFDRAVTMSEVADAAEFFASDLADMITGQYLIINGTGIEQRT